MEGVVSMIYQDANALKKHIAESQKELRRIEVAEKLDKIRGSDKVHKLMEEQQELFYAGEFDKARNKASEIFKALNTGSIVKVDMNPETQFAEYVSKGSTIVMPQEWGWREKEINGKQVDFHIELERGLIYPIGAEPGTGKTTVGVNLVHHFAEVKRPLNYRVLFLTNEMKAAQIWIKLMQVHFNKKFGKLYPFMFLKNWVRYPDKFPDGNKSMKEFAQSFKSNLRIANIRKLDINSIKMVIEEAQEDIGGTFDIIVFDYLQRVPRDAGFKSDMRLGVVDIVQNLSETAADLDAVIFLLSQMNKEGSFKESEITQEEAGIAWQIARVKDAKGNPDKYIDWTIKKSRISAYINIKTCYDDVSGTILDW
jgi:KaiC/GvpD/RAD55 family RecA-like ATPase